MEKNTYKKQEKIKNRIKSLEQMLTEDIFIWEKIKIEKKLNKLKKYVYNTKNIYYN